MPDQYVNVSRMVLSGGSPVGPTNEDLEINAGTHRFTLDGAQDYAPAFQRVTVTGTSPVSPLPLVFAKTVPVIVSPLPPPIES